MLSHPGRALHGVIQGQIVLVNEKGRLKLDKIYHWMEKIVNRESALPTTQNGMTLLVDSFCEMIELAIITFKNGECKIDQQTKFTINESLRFFHDKFDGIESILAFGKNQAAKYR